MRLELLNQQRWHATAEVVGTDPFGHHLAVARGSRLDVLDLTDGGRRWTARPRAGDARPVLCPGGDAIVLGRPDGLARIEASGRRTEVSLPGSGTQVRNDAHAVSRDGAWIWRVRYVDATRSSIELFDAATLYRRDVRRFPFVADELTLTATEEPGGVAVCCSAGGRHVALVFYRESGGHIVRHPHGVGQDEVDEAIDYVGHCSAGSGRFFTTDDYAMTGIWRWPSCDPIRFYALNAIGGGDAAIAYQLVKDHLAVLVADPSTRRPTAVHLCVEDGAGCRTRARLPLPETTRADDQVRLWPGGAVSILGGDGHELTLLRLPLEAAAAPVVATTTGTYAAEARP